MSTFLVLISVFLPLLLVTIWMAPCCRAWIGRLSVWAPLPAIFLAILGDDISVELPWLLLGSRWGLDTTGRVFLGFTATLWLAAGIYARSYLKRDPARDRFELFYLLTMAGNLGVIVALDMVSFLVFFTLMSFASYGLITHNRKPESMRAGRIYLILAVCGEICLFWAAILVVQQTGTLYFDGLAAKLAVSPKRHVITGLILVGFGIKLGTMPLHFWLPLAHPAAPTPASAVLSGAIIKTGLLGIIRFLPFGAVAIHGWGVAWIIAGIASAIMAVLIGLTQHNPKTVLAYSSISQMGLINIGIGTALMAPDHWTMIAAALLLYAAHHAVAKAALFLGVGVAQAEIRLPGQRMLVNVGLVVAALSLAGLPLTSGFAAKIALKDVVNTALEPWASVLKSLLPITGLMTTLLVGRFLYLVWPSRQHAHNRLTPAMAIPWGVLTAGVFAMFIGMCFRGIVVPAWVSLAPKQLWAGAWPIITAGSIVLLFWAKPSLRKLPRRLHIPEGDLVVPLEWIFDSCHRIGSTLDVTGISDSIKKRRQNIVDYVTANAARVLDRIELGLENEVTAGGLIGMLAVLMYALMTL